jgi:hypothetical protein
MKFSTKTKRIIRLTAVSEALLSQPNTPLPFPSKTRKQEAKPRETKRERMVLNSSVVAWVANVSADLWQYIACNPERLSSDHVLHLLFCLPFQHLHRLALSFCSPSPSSDDGDDDRDSLHSD